MVSTGETICERRRALVASAGDTLIAIAVDVIAERRRSGETPGESVDAVRVEVRRICSAIEHLVIEYVLSITDVDAEADSVLDRSDGDLIGAGLSGTSTTEAQHTFTGQLQSLLVRLTRNGPPERLGSSQQPLREIGHGLPHDPHIQNILVRNPWCCGSRRRMRWRWRRIETRVAPFVGLNRG